MFSPAGHGTVLKRKNNYFVCKESADNDDDDDDEEDEDENRSQQQCTKKNNCHSDYERTHRRPKTLSNLKHYGSSSHHNLLSGGEDSSSKVHSFEIALLLLPIARALQNKSAKNNGQ